MAKPFKIFLIVIGVLLALLVGAAVAIPLLFDPNDHRAQIETEAGKNTGRELKLGHLELHVFPWLAVGAKDVRVGNPEGFGDGAFAELKDVNAGIKLMPLLLDQKVEIGTIKVSGLRLNLVVDKDGKNNWTDWGQDEAEKKTEETEVKTEGEFKIEDLNIGGIEITDAALAYVDAQQGKQYSLQNMNLKTGAIRYGEPTDLSFNVALASSAPAAKADVNLDARIAWDLEAGQYGIENLLLKLRGSGEKLLAGEDANLDAELSGNIAAQTGKDVKLSGLKLGFKGGSTSLKLDGEYSGDVSYDLASGQLALPALALTVKASGKDIPGTQEVKLTGGLAYDGAQGTVKFSDAKLNAAGLALTTSISGSGLNGETPQLSGPISIASFNPRQLMTQFGIKPPETADPEVLKQMSMSANYRGSFKSAQLSDVVLKLDQSSLRGSINIKDFATQALTFALSVDQLDADRYLPPKKKEEKVEEQKGGGLGEINKIEIPAETLDKLNAEGTLSAGILKINGIKLTDAQVKLAGGRGAVKTQNISAKLYGGGIAFNNTFTPGKQPKYALKTELKTLNAGPFLQDFIGKDYVNGLGSLSVNLDSGGLTVGDLRKALNGDVGVKVENGAVKGFNLAQIIRKGQAALTGNLNYTETEAKQTDFSTMSFSAKIINGILKSDSLSAASPLFRLSGLGEINLVDETINYIAKPTIVETTKGEGGKGLEDLKGIEIPIKLSGSLFSPSYKIDLKEALKQKALGKVTTQLEGKKEELKQEREEAKDKLKEKLNDKLNKLFAPKQKAPEPPPAEQKPAESAPAGG